MDLLLLWLGKQCAAQGCIACLICAILVNGHITPPLAFDRGVTYFFSTALSCIPL